MTPAICQSCNRTTDHKHLHDEAHGISGTHMAGSERYICMECNRHTYATDPGDFDFFIDKPTPKPKRRLPPPTIEGEIVR